jgi:hypothetical protein
MVLAHAISRVFAVGLIVCPSAWARDGASQSFSDVPAVEVSGEASDTRTPDRVTVNVVVETQSATVETAMGSLAPRVSGVLEAVRASGVRDQDTSSDGPTATADFEVTRDDKGREIAERRIIGYRTEYNLRIATDRMDAVPGMVARISNAGGLVRRIEFSVSNAKEIGRELQERAAADAVDRARRLIRAVGAVPGRVLSIDQVGNGNAADLPTRRPPQPGVATQRIEVRPRQVTLEVSATVRVEMLSP